MTLTTHHLEFTATALSPVALDDQAGAAIRGAVVGGLWERFCSNRAAPTCADCPLTGVCPVAELIAPMRTDGESGGEQRPRPYVVQPPSGDSHNYAPGAALRFGLGLIGPAARLFPYVFMAAREIEQSGLGRRLRANGGRRGALQITQIAALNPLSGARQPLYQHGQPQVQTPGLPIDAADVQRAAAALPSDRLTLQFHTPLRLIDGDRLVKQFAARPFFARLAWRLDQLAITYGGGAPLVGRDAVEPLAERVQVAHDHTRWVDVVSYSTRTRQRTPIGGLVGQVTLVGDLAPLRELLVWGSLIHVGKNAVKGDGWYTLTAA